MRQVWPYYCQRPPCAAAAGGGGDGGNAVDQRGDLEPGPSRRVYGDGAATASLPATTMFILALSRTPH